VNNVRSTSKKLRDGVNEEAELTQALIRNACVAPIASSSLMLVSRWRVARMTC